MSAIGYRYNPEPVVDEPTIAELRAGMTDREHLKLLREYLAETGKEDDADDFINDYLWRHA